jgi:hypothetical protein
MIVSQSYFMPVFFVLKSKDKKETTKQLEEHGNEFKLKTC